MKTFVKLLKTLYNRITRSIAFYPVLLSFFFLVFALLALSFERTAFVVELKKNIPHLIIQDKDTAHTLLSVLIGGMLSLTVFSFTMVMVVLNQASTNFSPRLLPGLISDKKHQIILGVYIGTLIYTLILLTVLGAYTSEVGELGISIILAAISGIICIGLFVYFIHSISGAIQIHNIIDRIFREANTKIDLLTSKYSDANVDKPDLDYEGFEVKVPTTGYFKSFDPELLTVELREKLELIEVIPHEECHLWEGAILAKTKVSLSKEDEKSLLLCFHITKDRQNSEGYLEELIKLMEVAVKALSPGINDPGTARNVIGKLGQLCARVLSLDAIMIQQLAQKESIIVNHRISASDLLSIIFQPIRNYGKADLAVINMLIDCYRFFLNHDGISALDKNYIMLEVNALREDINEYISNARDQSFLSNKINELESIKNY
ncbi:DUF2254 domain-containing protein [Flavobacteriaceae bacterium M23B6Z8]